LAGRLKLGWSRIESLDVDGESFNDFIIDTDVIYKLGKRLAVGGLLQRARYVSGLSDSNFRLTTLGGVKGCVPLNRQRELFVDGRWIVGQNDYDDQALSNDPPITKDTFHQVDSGVNFVLPKNLVFRLGATYQNRDSNITTLNRDRFTINIGIALETRQNRVYGETETCTPVDLYE
jgi:hypothetical protein